MDISAIAHLAFSLLTLTFLEIVLGIDNLVFIAILSNRLPKAKQQLARRLGLVFALATRLLLLASALWLVGLTKPLVSIFGQNISGRDAFLLLGGLFLLFKGTREIHHEFDANQEVTVKRAAVSFIGIVIQIAVMDIIFSLDSILTAIGMTQNFWIMALAIFIAIIAMIIASEPLSEFIETHPPVKMLALSFLLLIGMVLIADGMGFDIPKGYIYFAISFSVFVESLNTLLTKRKQRKKALK
jgi:predicted tellurium resistance membrane protein TerC